MNPLKEFYRKCSGDRQSFLINVLSLIPGLVCCLLILSWVMYQLSIDRFHENIDRIAVVRGAHDNPEGKTFFMGCPPVIAPTLKNECPEVKNIARVLRNNGTVSAGEVAWEFNYSWADPDLFKILDAEFIDGGPFAEGETDKCVLAEDVAKGLFGSVSPVGKFVTLSNEGLNFVVSGVVKKLPRNNTYQYSGLFPMSKLAQMRDLSGWYGNMYVTYVLLDKPQSYGPFAEKIRERVFKEHPEYKLYLDTYWLKDRSMLIYGRQSQVYTLGIIALLMLLVACINFVNLSTAGFIKDSFQSGVRKVIGATRSRLIGNYLFYVVLLVLSAFVLAVVISIFCLPFFSTLIGQQFTVADYANWPTLFLCLSLIIVTSLLSGLYPSIFLSSFRPIDVLKGGMLKVGKSALFRNLLVVVQFTISIVLIVGILIVSKQIQMFNGMDMGYNRQEVMYVNVKGFNRSQVDVFKQALLRNSSIKAVSASKHVPTGIYWNSVGWSWEGKDPASSPLVSMTFVDKDWAEVMGIQMQEGNFGREGEQGVVINDVLKKLMGGQSVVGKDISQGDEIYPVVGVMDKFLFNDFKIGQFPLVIFSLEKATELNPEYLLVRVEGNEFKKMYDLIKKELNEVNGADLPVGFLDDFTQEELQTEQQVTKVVSLFSVLAVIISCMGLFGLATFLINQKRKEIGIRRVSGAKVSEIIWLLNVHFLKPIVVAFILACPIAYYVMSFWLEGYLYRVEISWWIFAFAGIITVGVAVLTLVWKSRKAATENPVKSLRNE